MRITLTQGHVALVDDADYHVVAGMRWHAWWSGWSWYAVNTHRGKTTYMHRFLLGAPAGQEVDHRNGNGLDNQRANLRLASSSQNKQNRSRVKSSGFKGVYWHGQRQRWTARIGGGPLVESCGKLRRRLLHLGMFDDEKSAALAYDAAAIAAFGEFAKLNFPRST